MRVPALTRRPSHRTHLHAIDATHDTAHAGKLPIAVSFITFQKLEKDCGDDFMGAAIEYAETYKDAKDLVKLAVLSKLFITNLELSGVQTQTQTLVV